MKRFKNILCVVDSKKNNTSALQQAAKLAESNQTGLTVVEVVEDISSDPTFFEQVLLLKDYQETIIRDCLANLKVMAGECCGQVAVETCVLAGIPFMEIIRKVLRDGHDLVVMNAEKNNLLNRLFSSHHMHLLRKCPCPVWLVKQQPHRDYQRIVAAVDVSDTHPADEINTRRELNHLILELATSLALSESAELHLVHAWTAPGESFLRGGFSAMPEDEVDSYVEKMKQLRIRNLDTFMDEIAQRTGQDALEFLKPEKHVIKGYPRKVIPQLAKSLDADLVVMGTVAHISLPGFFMGNTAEDILNQLDCSVLAVKPRGFRSPITVAE